MKLNFELTKGSTKDLVRMSELMGAEKLGDVVRESLRLMNYIQKQRVKGAKIVIHYQNGDKRQILFD